MTLNGTIWAPVGPSPVAENTSADNGMVTAIAVNPNNPNIIYIGTTAGGVWRSQDNGANWTPLFDRQLAIGIGEPGGVAIDPNNTDIIYAGTSQRNLLGDANPTFFNAPDPAPGLFKSIDGGSSWIQLGSGFPASNTGNALLTFQNNDINVVIVDPANSNTVYCAASNGVWVSNDGGQNWTLGVNSGGDVRSLVLDPTSPASARILYAGIVSAESRGAPGRGAFTSTDGGATWTPILTGSTTPVGLPSGFSKVIVALAPPTSTPNPGGIQVIYVTAEGTGATDPLGIFLSTNQGATWTQRTATNMPTNTQGGYSFHMAVDPASPGDGANDIIYFGTVRQARSKDAGNSFTTLTGIHADTHAWGFAPQPSPTPTTVFVGTDGGINQSTDNGSTWPSLNNGGLQTGLFYNIDVKPDVAASVIVGAVQDNEVETTSGAASALGWVGANGGDGWDVKYDGKIAKQVYCSSGFWSGTPPVPCTEVFVSTDDGQTYAGGGTGITPWTTATDAGCYLAPIATDPSNGGVVYVSGSQNLWQSQNSGGSWRIIGSFTSTGAVDVAPADGNNVAIAVGQQVFVSTNALATTGVSFTNITRDLPGRAVTRARFDPADPTVIYAVLGGYGGGSGSHVFRTTVSGSAWTDITPIVGGLPLDIPFNAIAMDGTVTPTTLFAGTDFGVLRSMDAGASWSVLDDLHFPRVEVSDLVFNPTAGVLVAATYGRGVFKFGSPTGPAIAVGLQDSLAFGTICAGPQYLTITVYNVGVTDLVVTNVQVLFGSSDFAVLPTPATPITVLPGDEVTFTVSYTPSTPGLSESAIIRIASNDPTAPFVDVEATGAMGAPTVATAIADNGDFGNVCLSSFADELLTINNSGTCPLLIYDITGSGDFLPPSVLSYPLLVDSGDSTDVVVRFQPSTYGSQSGTITIFSNDPASPQVVSVSGAAPAPTANLIIANTGGFGNVCIGSFTDEPLIVTNSGMCTLTVTDITSTSPEFLVPEVLSYPITIGPGDALPVPIRFQPTNFGAQTATITVRSDDPASPLSVNVSGTAPSGTLKFSGSTTFGGVNAGCCADRTVSICNIGDCALKVTGVHFRRRSRHWRLLNNPFPAKLRPGSCLPVVIQYHANEKCPRPCELVIESDDPATPVKVVDVLAYTVWESCCKECCCKEGCDDCRKNDCDKRHREPSCRQGYPCCDDDDDEDRDG
jgi:protein involved in polysaccharide export with SLBB domain